MHHVGLLRFFCGVVGRDTGMPATALLPFEAEEITPPISPVVAQFTKAAGS
jgi:hypothetical protein